MTLSENIKLLLKGAGYSDDVIKSAEDKEFKADEAVTTLEETNKERFKELFKNDDSYKEEITRARDGYWLGNIRQELKKSGIEKEAIPEDMKIKDIFKLVKDKVKTDAEAATGKVSEEVTRLQAENLEWKNKVTETTEQYETRIKDVLNQAKAEVTKEKVDYRLRNSFTGIPAEKILGGKHSDGLFLALKNVMDTKYDSNLDEQGNPVFFVKGKQSKPEGKVDGKDRILTSDELLMSELKGLGFIVESNGNGKQTETKKTESYVPANGEKSERTREMEQRFLEAKSKQAAN